MVTADVLAVVFVLIGLFLAVPAFQLGCRALFPRFATQSRWRFEQTPATAFGAGLLVGVPVSMPLLMLLGAGPGPVRFAGVLGLAVLLGMSLAGLQGLAMRVGSTMPSRRGDDPPWWLLAKGSVVLGLACLLPLLGWFLLAPGLLVAGTGATLLAWVRPLRDSARPAPVVEMAVRAQS